MATQVQFRRGTTADISTFIGADGEVVVDTTKKTCVVHDGVKIAGYPLLREDGSNSALNVGSLSSCALKFINDPNTGIISPGADQIALVTGGASRLSVDSSGSVTIPGNLLVAGAFTGTITLDNGSAAVPALRFTNDPDTGIYLAGTNEVAISTGGTQRLTTTTTEVTSTLPVLHPLGAAATPSLSFVGDTNTGMYSPGADQVAISTGGTQRLTTTTTEVTSTLPVLHPLGAAATPSLTFTGDTNTGVYSPGADQLAISTAATERARFDESGRLLVGTSSAIAAAPLLQIEQIAGAEIVLGRQDTSVVADDLIGSISFWGRDTSGVAYTEQGSVKCFADGTHDPGTNPTRLVFSTTADGAASPTERMRIDSAGQIEAGSLGTAAAPVWSFLADPNTGIYAPGADQVAISTGGTQRLTTTTTEVTSTLPVLHPLGAAATPSLTFTGDTNTGLYSPGADQVAISTNGTGRLFVDASGNVGFNVSPPTSYTNYTTLSINGTAGGAVSLRSGGTMIGELFSTSSALKLGSNTSQPIVFETNGGIERMRLDSSGRLGLGTSNPGSPLTIESNAGNQIKITYPSIASYYLNATSGGDFAINKDGTERVRIDTSGRLLIGSSSAPSAGSWAQYAKLTVKGYVGGDAETGILNISRGEASTSIVSGEDIGVISFSDTTGNEYAWIRCAADANAGSGDYPGRLVFSTTSDGAASPTERMRIDSSGRLGIGTTSPQHLLDCASIGRFTGKTNGAASGTGIEIGYDPDTTTGFIQSYNRATSAYVSTAVDGSDVRFKISGAERARIDSSGRLGLGTSSPSDALHIASGNFRLTNGSAFTSSNATIASISSFAGSANQFETTKISFETDAFVNRGEIVFSTGDDSNTCTEKARIDYLGRLGLGTSSPAGLLDVRGEIKAGSFDSINGTTLLSDSYTTGGASFGSLCIERGTGVFALTTNIKHAENAAGYISTNTVDFGKSALKLGSTGLFYATASASVVPIGNSVSLTDKFVVTNAGNVLIGTSSDSGGALLQVNGDRVRIATAKTPASATDTGVAGEICWDANYVYVCTATNTWKRSAISTW